MQDAQQAAPQGNVQDPSQTTAAPTLEQTVSQLVQTVQTQGQLLSTQGQQTQSILQQLQQLVSVMPAAPTVSPVQPAQQATATASAVTAVPNPSFKPPKPEFFSGHQPKQLVAWTLSMEQYLNAIQMPLNTPTAAAAAAMYLKDHALQWYHAMYSKGVIFTDFMSLKDALIATFLPGDRERAARDDLSRLRQTSSATHYSAAFNALICQIPTMSEEDRVYRYIAGLKQEVKKYVTLGNPQQLVDAQSLAVRTDNVVWSDPASRAAASRSSNGPVPMELGATQASGGRYANYVCDKCGQLGHIARFCHNKAAVPAASGQESGRGRGRFNSRGRGGGRGRGRQQHTQPPN
jgi:hypothetical protein